MENCTATFEIRIALLDVKRPHCGKKTKGWTDFGEYKISQEICPFGKLFFIILIF